MVGVSQRLNVALLGSEAFTQQHQHNEHNPNNNVRLLPQYSRFTDVFIPSGWTTSVASRRKPFTAVKERVLMSFNEDSCETF